jgi:hypothetical protein
VTSNSKEQPQFHIPSARAVLRSLSAIRKARKDISTPGGHVPLIFASSISKEGRINREEWTYM